MLKKAALAVFGLVLAVGFAMPQKAQAEVHVGVAIGAPGVYGGVVVQTSPYATYSEPYYSAPGYYVAPQYYGPSAYYRGYDRDDWRHRDHEDRHERVEQGRHEHSRADR